MSLIPVRAAFQLVGQRSKSNNYLSSRKKNRGKGLKTHLEVIVNQRYLLLKTSKLALKELADHPLR
jgi:hypothetical protein